MNSRAIARRLMQAVVQVASPNADLRAILAELRDWLAGVLDE